MPPFAPTNDADSSDEDRDRAMVNRLKRRISELEAQEKRVQAKNNAVSQSKSFANLGRVICKVVSTFDSPETLIAEDDRRRDLEDARTSGNEVHEEDQSPTIEQNILHNGYKELCRFIVPIRKLLAEAEYDELSPVLGALRGSSRNARSDDTKNLREAIIPWLNIVFPNITPALDPHSRDNRGIFHDDLGRLLCPVEFDWDDEDVRTAIREGDPHYQVTADSWWTGLYPFGKFDPQNPEAHLFTNVLLLKVYKYIFTSPLSVKSMAKDKDIENSPPISSPTRHTPTSRAKPKKVGTKSKRNVAAIIGLKAVTGRSIAYAAVQYRVALSDAGHWDDEDGAFNYPAFYNNIVEYFEFPPSPVARQKVALLLDWWNTNVFGATPRWDLYANAESPFVPTSSVAAMRAARAARETEV
ncbi:hypothetical protein DFH08DRAFT_1033888 [Mycena albidolilacea]|uniref:Uncharacterized protein n=1 Tax=Mycena albidolilacea TaxID=1033008 RepID=A0AAD6ZFZ0_9AGAR|nr:hypothetical protein DFH08DRAFT_1033888 [Mycena albidolilacea]